MRTARERAILDRLLDLADHADERTIADNIGRLIERIPTHQRDQQRAAARDADQQLHGIAATGRYCGPHPITPAPRARAAITAAMLRCLAGHHCQHAPQLDRPIYCFAAPRIAACAACLCRFRGPLIAHDRRVAAGLDRTCDSCLNDPANNTFTPHVLTVGAAIVVLDVCDHCHEQIATEPEHAA